MAQLGGIQVVTRERHAGLYWQKVTDFSFARKNVVVPLAAREFPKALLSLPLGFAPEGDGYMSVALTGLLKDQNLLVGKDGEWLGEFVPAFYQCYPFRLGHAGKEDNVLCIDEGSGLVQQDASGERFFTDAGSPSPALSEAFSALLQLESDRNVSQRICAQLQQHRLIQPWPIQVRNVDGQMLRVDGVFRIDEAALQNLSSTALAELRDSSALLLAYCQLLSMQQLRQLGRLAGLQYKIQQLRGGPKAVPLPGIGIFEDSGTISFDNL